MLHRGEHARLQARHQGALRIGLVVERHQLVRLLRRHQRGAPAGQQRVIDPALGPLPIADAAPIVRLGGDLHRQAGAGEHEGDLVVPVGPAPHGDAIGLEADEARDRQAAGGAHRQVARRGGLRLEQPSRRASRSARAPAAKQRRAFARVRSAGAFRRAARARIMGRSKHADDGRGYGTMLCLDRTFW